MESTTVDGATTQTTVTAESAKLEEPVAETPVIAETPAPVKVETEAHRSPGRRDRGPRYSRVRSSQKAAPVSPSKLEEPKTETPPAAVGFTDIEKPPGARDAAAPLVAEDTPLSAHSTGLSSSEDRPKKPASKAGSSIRRHAGSRGRRPRSKTS
jgi:hypothetical protein